ncbi:CPBP family intramembrane glutamic endopeptidase [Marinobacter sp. CHS3-4]|uniref:CPBP family intramembrane glutamic endopeptidase n=1 Tax=Marinobacter sp. CHS3-4 TaxID=3045174 RepID=UPI0024B4E1E2|nr:CPBP family intramembrane glutamic endopeptidase [Marinobacter sp. CHS3-4]MDI9246052.1 CPBP family intramembrane metalloprotease [Marinobacter sp. CHS3-4]
MPQDTRKISTAAALGFQGSIAVVGALAVWLLGVDALTSQHGWAVDAGLGIAGSLVTFVALSGLSRAAGPMQDLLSEHMRQLQSFANDYGWWVLAALSLLAGVGEELLFRGALQGWMTRHLNDAFAIVLAAMAFGLVHYLSFVYFLIATGLGLVLGIVYWLTDSLLLVMVWHGVYDMIALYALRRHPERFGIH